MHTRGVCRLLGAVSARPVALRDLLAPDLAPFRALAEEHCDGWGIAHHRPGAGLHVRKDPRHAHDGPHFDEAVDAADPVGAAILHLRKASTGMAPTTANTHPFAAGPPWAAEPVAFAHNGFFGPHEPVGAALEAAGGRPCEGDTDSERWFGLVLAAMRDLPPEAALPAAAARIAALSGVEALNALLLSGDRLYAYARYDDDVVAARNGPVGSYEMWYRMDPGRVVVASNGWEESSPAWQPLPNGAVLEVRRAAGTPTAVVHPAERGSVVR